MKDLIDIFKMEELTAKTRCNLLIKAGQLINHQYGSNITEPVVAELVNLLDPEHEILKDEFYKKHLL